MGLDDEIMIKYNAVVSKIADIENEIKILVNAHDDIQKKHPPEVRNVMDMFIKIEKAIVLKNKHLKEANEEREKLQNSIDTARSCKAVVRGDVYEGVMFSIDNSKWRSPGLKNVVIEKRLNATSVNVQFN